jgi:predicted metal-dependent enzyme (double-stranded beta helix superfamily)
MEFSIDQMIADCLEAVQDSGGHPGAAVEEVLARVVSNPAAIEAATGQRHDQPVMTTWLNTDELTVLHIVWPPEADLMAHDHLMWAAIGLYGGREENRLFRALPDGSLEHRRTRTLQSGDTILLGGDTVHAVANPSREWTGAIHVYGGDYFRGGKHMWPQPEHPAVPFNIEVVRNTLNEAASRAMAFDSVLS